MRILAIDTSTARLTVAVTYDGELVASATAGELTGGQVHGEALAGLVSSCLAGATPDRVAVGIGPGPYTGLRVGVVTAEVLADAWRCELVGVPTLQAIAHGYRRRGGGECIAVQDVKRREVAWQRFAVDGAAPASAQLLSITELAQLPAGVPLVGPAFVSQRLVQPQVADASPVEAFDIALIAAVATPTPTVAPLYLRQPDAAEPHAPKRVTHE